MTSVIVGANSLAQIQESLAAAGIQLTEEEKRALDEQSDWEK